MKRPIGVSADDVTGANDIGIMFKKGGLRSAVFPLSLIHRCNLKAESENLDVIIIDTDSRFDLPETARCKVRRATELLMTLNCRIYHNKTCSVFRGNIGAEFDAMQDTLGIKSSMVIAGFPQNGRTTVDGIHYVYGKRLEDSQFKNDPIHKMTTSSLMEIMKKQTKRPIGLLTWEDLDKGFEYAWRKKEELKKRFAYIIFDVRDEKDLVLISQIIKDEMNICGSSAIGRYLPEAYKKAADREGCFLLSGSLTAQSTAQAGYMKESGCPAFEFPADCIYEKEREEAEIKRLIELSVHGIKDYGRALVHTSNRPEQVEAVKKQGILMGLSHEEIGKGISHAMCRIAKAVLMESGCRNLVVAGGDTSAAVTEGLEIYRMEIGEEIEPGVPVMKGESSLGTLNLVLKSGSFGSDAFLEKAAEQTEYYSKED